MALTEENTFSRNDVFPSWFANAIQRFLSTSAPSFQLTKQDATHIQVTAAAADGAAVIAIAGNWRWIEATINRSHPGGAAGTWDIFVVAANNVIEPGGTDATNRAFALRIIESGKTPTPEAGAEIFRKVGSLQWSGTEITRVDQTVPPTPSHAHRHATGQPDAIAPADIGAAPESEAEALREALLDVFQAGVVQQSDWAMTPTIVSGTGVLGSAGSVGGVAWVNSGAALVRTVKVPAALSGIVPPSLPASGKFRSIGLQLAASTFGNAPTLSAVAGSEVTTEAEALANPAAPVANRVRIIDIIVKNTAGVFSIATSRDRRPWAAGARALAGAAVEKTTTSTSFVAIDTTNLSLRVECTGRPMILLSQFSVFSSITAEGALGFLMDGGTVSGAGRFSVGTGEETITFEVETTPTAGSHLFQAAWLTGAGTLKMPFNAGSNLFRVIEMPPTRSNGTS
jgi:hypothetical protein